MGGLHRNPYPYGIAINTNTGHLIRTIHRFPTAAARNAWVEDGEPVRHNRNHRESLTARQVAPDIRRQAAAAPHGVPVWECNDHGGDRLV